MRSVSGEDSRAGWGAGALLDCAMDASVTAAITAELRGWSPRAQLEVVAIEAVPLHELQRNSIGASERNIDPYMSSHPPVEVSKCTVAVHLFLRPL